MAVSLKLFGSFQLCSQLGMELTLRTRKVRALLAYLATQPSDQHSRERLTELLWGNRSEKQARQSLNNALMAIRKLPCGDKGPLIHSDREFVRLNTATIESDLMQFRNFLATDPARAISLYKGPFLEDLIIAENNFEEWSSRTRSKFHTLACDALLKLAESAVTRGDRQSGIAMLRRLTELDPLIESAHRQLMSLQFDEGDRIGALRQYQICVDILQQELQVPPDPLTIQLAADIRAASVRRASREPASVRVGKVYEQQALPDRPSIAVLPFINVSGDPARDYVADGITEDVTTGLSLFRSLFVIARNSAFEYNKKPIDVRKVAQDLDVRYILEGSVRHTDNQIRIAVQLIDALTRRHLWAEKYARCFNDLFAIQDEITGTIVATLEPQISVIESQSARRKHTSQLNAWECYQRGLWHYRQVTQKDNAEACRLMHKATELDADFSLAYAGLAEIYRRSVSEGWANNSETARKKALEAATKALALDPNDPQARYAMGRIAQIEGRYETAISEFREALSLNPNLAFASFGLGSALVFAGRAQEALGPLKRAVRLSPRDPQRVRMDLMIGVAHFMLKDHQDALPWFQRSTLIFNDYIWPHLGLSANLAALGQIEQSKMALKQALKIKPDLTIRFVADFLRGQCVEYNDYYLAQLKIAGLPD